MVNDLKYIDFGDDCIAIMVPIYIVSSSYSGYVLARQSTFVEYCISHISNSSTGTPTHNDYLDIYNLYGNCVLQKDTLFINSDVTPAYMEDTLFRFLFSKVEYDCSLIHYPTIQNRKLLRELFTNNGCLRRGKYKNYRQHICELFRYGYITIAEWCSSAIRIYLVSPQTLSEMASRVKK